MGEKNRDSQWRNCVGRDRGGLGNAVFQNVSYKGKEIIMIEDTGTGSIYANEQISQNYNIPNDTKNIIAEVNLLTNKNESSQFESIILGVIQTFQFR